MKYAVRSLFLILAVMGVCSCASLPSYNGYSGDPDARYRAIAESAWRSNFYGSSDGLNLSRMFASPAQ
jgi:hypothetical protein